MSEQMNKGREAYRLMEEACDKLVSSGSWQRVGSSDIKLFLNMYVQALLLRLAQANGAATENLLRFAAEVPSGDCAFHRP